MYHHHFLSVKNQYPLFLEPDEKISMKNITTALNATYKCTVLDRNAKRSIGVDSTTKSRITVLKQW